jgi:hypothetical protein
MPSFTPGLWILTLGKALHYLDETSREFFNFLPKFRAMQRRNEDVSIGGEIDAMCEAARGLKEISQAPENESFPISACAAFVALVRALPESEYAACYDILLVGVAHNLLQFSEYLSNNRPLDFWWEAANLLDRIARRGGKPPQMAVGAMAVAMTSMAMADKDPQLRPNAFRACEVAVERLRALDKGIRKFLHGAFIDALLHRQYVSVLSIYFVHEIDNLPRKEEILAVVGSEPTRAAMAWAIS